MPSNALAEINAIGKIECGEDAAKHFLFDGRYRNLNHGSFGTYPREIRSTLRSFQDQCEGRPDWFIRYEYPRRLDESRAAIARYIKAPTETCVFVPNATTGINTILRNLVWEENDVIIYFATIYGACHKTIEYLCETTPLQAERVGYVYPCEDGALLRAFERKIAEIRASGRRPRAAVFDTIVSMPGVRMPFESLTRICRQQGLLSVIDAAHCVGQIPVDLTALDPDFFVSNCHKWLHVPRGCAVLYVPVRNQNLMRSTLPTSHGFVPKNGSGLVSPLPPSAKGDFVNNFEFVGTVDNAPFLCIPSALAWRQKITWKGLKGEEAVMGYCTHLATRAGQIVSSILGTEVMDNAEGTLTNCSFANVRLPLSSSDSQVATAQSVPQPTSSPRQMMTNDMLRWISQTLVDEYETFLAIVVHGGKLWVRLSANVYLTERDFEWAGAVLKSVCERAGRGEWKGDEERAKRAKL